MKQNKYIPLSELVARNQDYNRTEKRKSLSMKPRFLGVIISCMDARFDPAHLFGLEEGDALVLRSMGGRITKDIIEHIAFIAGVAKKQRLECDEDPVLEVVILHHTDCGAENFTDPMVRKALAEGTGVSEVTYASFAIHDHETALREDLEKLRASPLIADFVQVAGFIVDHETGRAKSLNTTAISGSKPLQSAR